METPKIKQYVFVAHEQYGDSATPPYAVFSSEELAKIFVAGARAAHNGSVIYSKYEIDAVEPTDGPR